MGVGGPELEPVYLFMNCREGVFSETALPTLLVLGNPRAESALSGCNHKYTRFV
jgi:hypothetical protein